MTTRIPFTKAQALGNDFVIVEESVCALDMLATIAKTLADRRQGVGCDQVIFYEVSTNTAPHTFTLRFFNADGSESDACGNGTRAFALFASQRLNSPTITVQTKAETFACTIEVSETNTAQVSVTLSHGTFLPLNAILEDDLHFFFDDRLKHIAAVDVGNPHLVLFLEDYTYEDVSDIGEQLTRHPFFKKGVNVGFVKMPPKPSGIVVNFPGISPRVKHEDERRGALSTLTLSVCERGVGPTPACGTGAYAAYLAAQKFLPLASPFTIQQDGGLLTFLPIDTMYKVTGDASLVFEGVFYL